MDATIW